MRNFVATLLILLLMLGALGIGAHLSHGRLHPPMPKNITALFIHPR